MAHILLVEDDSDIMRINRSFLEKEGYAVHCADSVQQAAFLLEECVPDLVLLDVMLPDGDGMDFCQILRKRRCKGTSGYILKKTFHFRKGQFPGVQELPV